MKIVIEATGTSPLLMHNPRMVDPEFEIVREIKALTIKKKRTDADFAMIEKLEWYGGMYEENGIVVQPTSKLRKCIIETARINKNGKAVERALSFNALNVPLVYDGPRKIDELFADKKFHSRLSVRMGMKRIMRVRPQFFPWTIQQEGLFIDDAGLNFDELEAVVALAGVTTGIGDNRVNGYGRFIGKVRRVK